MRVNFKYANGDEVTEKITGFKGVITGAVCYLTGCNQYLITAKSKSDKEEATVIWYDEGRLALTIKEKVSQKEVEADDNGCDVQAPIK